MAYTPIPKGEHDWDVPVNAAFANQDARITTLEDSVGGANFYLMVAAATAPDSVKAKADFIADGLNDQAAIQQAVDAAFSAGGGIVQLSAGVFNTTGPVTLHPLVTLQGVHGDQIFNPDQLTSTSYISPSATFSGGAAIVMLGQLAGGYANKSAEQRVRHLTIKGDLSPAGIHGIQGSDYIHGVTLEDVAIVRPTGKGIYTFTENGSQPFSWTMRRVLVDNSVGVGIHLINHTDFTGVDVISIGAGSDAYVLSNMPNSRMIGCRAEWSEGHGYKIEGNWGTGAGSGGMVFSGCSTDRNRANGFDITSTGNGPITITGCYTRRDGRNGGSGGAGFAGMFVAGSTTPVIVTGWGQYPGQDDDFSGVISPENGAVFTNNTSVQLDNSYIHGATTSLTQSGNTIFLQGDSVVHATGDTNAPVRSVPAPLNVDWQPYDSGFAYWTSDPAVNAGSATSATGNIYYVKIAVRRRTLVTNLSITVATAGATLTAGQNLLGLYSEAGVLLSKTADQSGVWTSVGMKTAALLTPQTIEPGYYWVAMMSNGTTPANFMRGNSQSSSAVNINRLRYVNTAAGATDLPANFTPGSANTDNNARWAALS